MASARLVVLVGAWLVAACSGESARITETAQPTKLAFVTQPSSAAAGASLGSIQVAVQDAGGATVASATHSITLSISAGTGSSGASLVGTVTQAAVNGVASFSGLSIARAGAGYTLSASASGLAGASSAAFTVAPGAADRLVILAQPSNVAAGSAIAPSVQIAIHDAHANLVTSATNSVTLAIASGSGAPGATLGGGATQAAVAGVASFSGLTIDKAAAGYMLAASATGLAGTTTSAFTVNPGPAVRLEIVAQPGSATAATPIAPAVQFAVRDAFGNAVSSSTHGVTVAIAGGTGTSGATLGGTLTQNTSNGVATFANLTIDKAGSGYALSGNSSGLTGATTTTFTVSPGAAAKLAYSVSPSNASAGASINPAIQVVVQDAGGNTVTTASNSITLGITSGTGASGATLSGTLARAASAGIATFSNISINKSANGYTLDATASGLTLARSSAFNITPGVPSRLAFTVQPSAAAPGAVIAPAVQVAVRDAHDNLVTTATNSVTLGISSGTGTSGAVLSGTLTRAAASGVASFNDLSIDLAGNNYTLAASATSLNGATSAAFNITQAPAAGCGNPAPGWIFCDDFEVDRFASYFEVSTDNNSMARVNGVGRNGGFGIRARFASGQTSAGSLKLAFGRTPAAYFKPVDAGTRDYREIYWRVYLRHQSGWTGGGGDKLSRITIFAASSWAQAMIGHVWSGSGADANYLVLDPASGTDAAGNLKTTGYNDFNNLRWLGPVRSATAIFSSANVGQWYCIETRVKLNTTGQSDGLFELRINGQLEASRTGLNWVGNYAAYGLNAILLESFWNDGSPAAQERYFDDFVVSEQPIGC